jgi:hypothetical protein
MLLIQLGFNDINNEMDMNRVVTIIGLILILAAGVFIDSGDTGW